PITDRQSFDVGAQLHYLARSFPTRDKGRLYLNVVLARDPQHIGVAHATCAQTDLDLARRRRWRRDRLDHQPFWPAQGFTHYDLHLSAPKSRGANAPAHKSRLLQPPERCGMAASQTRPALFRKGR